MIELNEKENSLEIIPQSDNSCISYHSYPSVIGVSCIMQLPMPLGKKSGELRTTSSFYRHFSIGINFWRPVAYDTRINKESYSSFSETLPYSYFTKL